MKRSERSSTRAVGFPAMFVQGVSETETVVDPGGAYDGNGIVPNRSVFTKFTRRMAVDSV
jgi:hypothetical protein